MDEFNLQLKGQLEQKSSESQINDDLVTIAKAIEKLRIQAEIDPNSVKNIAQQLSKIMNQKVVVNNIQIDTKQTIKAGEQLGQNLGNTLNKNLASSLNSVKQNIDNVIKGFSNQKLNSYDLSKMFNLNRSNIDGSVIQQVRNLTNELNSLAKEALKTNSDSSWEGIVNKISSLSKVLSSFGTGRDLTAFKESLDVLDYFQNKKIFVGDKSEALSNTGMGIKELNNQFRNLGVTFTTISEDSTKLDTIWTELFNISPNLQNFNVFGDQLNAIVEHLKVAKEALYGDSNLQPLNGGEVNKVLLDWLENLENASKKLNVFREEQTELEQRIAQSSTSTANTVVQNEERKQRAYNKTSKAYKTISSEESIVKSGTGVLTFEGTNNAAKEAQQYFRDLLKDEQAVIATTEQFGQNNNLTSFVVNIKRASGEVESLRYTIDSLKDSEGNIEQIFYKLGGSSVNDSGAIKQIKAIENAFANFTQKIEQFKSTNGGKLSGLTVPLSDFESKLNGLKNGTNTIDEVSNSFKLLQAEAAKIDAPLKRQLSTFDSYKNAVDKGKESISGYRAELKGLTNAPKELSQELTKASKLLLQINRTEATEGTTANWSNQAREFVDLLTNIGNKINVIKKEQANSASTQIFNTKDLDAQGKIYIQKINNTIEKTKSEIEGKLHNAGYMDIEIKGVEYASGKIKSLTANVTDATGAFKQLNFERAQLQNTGKAQPGLMQTDEVKIIGNISSAIQTVQDNLSSLRAKWEDQGILVGEFKTKIEQLETSLTSVGSKSELNNLETKIQGLKNEASTIAQVNKIQLSIETGGYESKVDSLITKTQQWTDQNGNARISTDALSTALKNLGDASTALSNNNTIENQKALIAAEKELDTQLKIVTNSVKSMNAAYMKSSAVDNLRQKVQQFYDLNGKSHFNWGSDLKRIMNELGQGMEVPIAKGKQLEQEFIQIQNAARQAGKLGKTWFQTLREGMSSFSYWTSSTFLVMKAIQSVKSGISTVKALDTALVDLKKTTTMSASELEDFYYASNKVAKQMGVTTEEIINQAAEFSRLGYSSKEAATQMAKYSSWFKTISPGMSIEQAGDTLTSIIKAFKYDVQDIEKIMSMINTVGNNFAVSNLDISEILTRSSSAMMEANNSLADTIALGTAA